MARKKGDPSSYADYTLGDLQSICGIANTKTMYKSFFMDKKKLGKPATKNILLLLSAVFMAYPQISAAQTTDSLSGTGAWKLPVEAMDWQDAKTGDGSALDQTVSAGSRQEERIVDVPGIAQVITKVELQAFGGNNLADILNRATGMMVGGSFRLPNNFAVMRGDYTNDLTGNILMLIDGKPCFESLFGGSDLGLLNTYPIESLERVEIIRGQGSVFYGTRSFTGVINLVTSQSEKSGAETALVSGGNGYKAIVFKQDYVKNRVRIHSTGKYSGQNGLGTPYKDFQGNDFVMPLESQNFGFMGRASYGRLSLEGFMGDTYRAVPGEVPGTFAIGESDDKLHARRGFLSLSYARPFTKKWDFAAHVTYNNSLVNGNLFVHNISTSSPSTVLEVTNKLYLRKNLTVLAGFTETVFRNKVESHLPDGTNGSLLPEIETEPYHNVYAQADWQPFRFLRTNMGLQVNRINEAITASYRGSLNFALSRVMGIKINGGGALKPISEFIEESTVFKRELGNNLEQSFNGDLMLYLQKRRFYISGNVFLAAHANKVLFYLKKENDVILPYVENYDSLAFFGFESDMKWQVSEKFVITSNFMIFFNALTDSANTEKGIENVVSSPNKMFKGGLGYTGKNITLSVFGSYWSKPADIINIQNKVPENSGLRRKIVNPVPTAAKLLSFNIKFDIKALLRLRDFPSTSLTFYGENLLDQKLWMPENVYRRSNSMPYTGLGGRAVYGTVSIKF